MPFGCEHSTRTSANSDYTPGGNRCQEGKRKRRNALQIEWLYFFLLHLFLEIFPVEDIPFPPALGDLPGEFRDLLPDERAYLVLHPHIEPDELFLLPERPHAPESLSRAAATARSSSSPRRNSDITSPVFFPRSRTSSAFVRISPFS